MKIPEKKLIQISGGVVILIIGMFMVMPCLEQTDSGPDTPKLLSYTEFKAQAFQETYLGSPTGVYILDGDVPVDSEARMQHIYDEYVLAYNRAYRHAAVDTINGVDILWSATNKLQLTYCISNAFGGLKPKVITAMTDATSAWEAAANINFTYLPAEDVNCTSANTNVMFDVEFTFGQSYTARSFFPITSRVFRNIMINVSSFSLPAPLTLTGILRHELGHTLGLRHEHTRPEAGTCFEDNEWRPLTTYDSKSVMHYPSCNGTGDWSLTLSPQDIQAIGAIYGAP